MVAEMLGDAVPSIRVVPLLVAHVGMGQWCSRACHGWGTGLGHGSGCSPQAAPLCRSSPCSLTRCAGPGLTYWVSLVCCAPWAPARPSCQGTWCRWLRRAVRRGAEVLLGLWHRCDRGCTACLHNLCLFYLLCSEHCVHPAHTGVAVPMLPFFSAITADRLIVFISLKETSRKCLKLKLYF